MASAKPCGSTRGHGRISRFEQHDGWVCLIGNAATAYPATSLERYERHLKATLPEAVEARCIAVVQVPRPGVTKSPLRHLKDGVEVGQWRVSFHSDSHRLKMVKK